MKRYSMKPTIVEAVQLKRDNAEEMERFVSVGNIGLGDDAQYDRGENEDELNLAVETPTGIEIVSEGDWIMRYDGELSITDNTTFAFGFEEAEEDPLGPITEEELDAAR